MKNAWIIILLFFYFSASAQISEGGMPYTFHQSQLKAGISIPDFKLKKLNNSKLQEEDAENPTPFRYSIFENTEIDLKTGVAAISTEHKGKIWRNSITSENAYSIQIVFKKFAIPVGAKLFIYNNNYSVVYGAFTHQNMEQDSSFTVADFPGNSLTIEYFEPENTLFEGEVIIGQIGQAYQNILENLNDEAAEENYIDVNCIEGKNWQNEKHAVCKITFKVGNSGYVCSGALINNTANDGTPYFLTANHCIDDTTTAKTLVAYFNYEKRSCNGSSNSFRTLSGARLLTTGKKSDYTLLRLNNTPSAIFLPFYAGWDISNYQDNQNTSIHHPEGIEKKISIDYENIITYDFVISWDEGGTTPPSSHWQVTFDDGLTAEGSSGGPLFSKQKRIIGQLHGGGEGEEFYGKLNYSWVNSDSGFPPLKNFLDPKNTGTTTLNGYFPTTNPPDAFFTTNFTNVCLNTPITLFENSAFSPTSRTWTISPSSYTFVNGTNRNSINPQVQFTRSTSYTIKLNVSNPSGTDSLQLANALTAGNINVSMASNQGNSLCYNELDTIVLTGYGAENFSWNLGTTNSPFILSRIIGDTAILRKQANAIIDSTYSLNVLVTGTMGTCTDTAQQKLEFIQASNDNIANAIEIGLGKSKEFSNFCATIETNEPVPPSDSCTGIKSWCDEYGNGKNIVENSVWFKFKGPASGKAGLKSFGFDNEIAVYDANSYQDILNGVYTLLAANDDESDENANPTIAEITVQPGKMYWIQIDGSGGGSEGSFTITLSDKNITPTPEIKEDANVLIYPQPVSSLLTIQTDDFQNGDTQIKIYNLSGKIFLEKVVSKLNSSETSVNVEYLSPGVYLLKLTQGDKTTIKKFIKN